MRKTLNLGITINKAADFSVIIEVPSDGLPLDITGYVFTGQIKESTADAEPIATFDFDVLNQTTNKGKVKWSLSSDDTLALTTTISTGESACRIKTPYIYDVMMVDTVGFRTRIIQGPCDVSPEVTAPEVGP